MSTMKITEQGRAIIANAFTGANSGGAKYWVGYYGLAYVDRSDEAESIENVTTKLTQKGDYIYNIWQGDLTGTGFAIDDNSGAKSLFGLTMYDKNICSNYRYVMDADGRNNLVAWRSGGTNGAEDVKHRESYKIYRGYDVETGAASEMPLPAPLFYYNDPLGADESLSSPGGITEAEFDAKLGGKPGMYSDLPHNGSVLPMVSDDARYYTGFTGVGELTQFDQAISISDDGKWVSSEITRQDNPSGLSKVYAKLRSISNYNLQHGTVSSEGYNLSSISACHNMSKSTKLFPISSYQVLVDGQGAGGNPETRVSDRSTASSIKFGISLSPITYDKTYLDVIDNLADDSETDIKDENDVNLFDTKKNRFKFNRIGIYAVQMEVRRFAEKIDSDTCSADHVQFEIINDADPILFAVADVNETVVSDSGNGTGRIELEFVLNMDGVPETTQLINDTGIFYNLYENSSITWYENQLLASAGLSEAVTSLGIDVANLRRQVGKATSAAACEGGSGNSGYALDMSQYAKVNHTHAFMKNLIDGASNAGSVQGIGSVSDGYTDPDTGDVYNLGKYTIALGKDTKGAGDYSIVQGVGSAANGAGNLIVGADGSISEGDGNVILGAADPVSIAKNSPNNAVVALRAGGANLDSSTGNVVFGLHVDEADGDEDAASECKLDISNSHGNMVFGNIPGSADESVTVGVNSCHQSIIGINGAQRSGGGSINEIYQSLLIGAVGMTAKAKRSIMVGGGRNNCWSEDYLLVGTSNGHSVQFEDLTDSEGNVIYGVTGKTESKENKVTGVQDMTDEGTGVYNGNNARGMWIGTGDVYGRVSDSILAGDYTVGKWHLYDYDGEANTRRIRKENTGLMMAGIHNEIGYGTTRTIMSGDDNAVADGNGMIVVGSNNNSNNSARTIEMEEFYSAADFTAKYGSGTPSRNIVAWLYLTGRESVTVSGSTYIAYEGTTAIQYEPGKGWGLFNKEKDQSAVSTWPAAWGFDYVFYKSSQPVNVSDSIFIGSNNNWGSNTSGSMINGNDNDLRYLAVKKSIILTDSLEFGAPIGNRATEFVQKTFDSVHVLASNAVVNAALAQFNNAPEKTYSNAVVALAGYSDATLSENLAHVLGTSNSYRFGRCYSEGKYNVRPYMRFVDGSPKWFDSTDGTETDISWDVDTYSEIIYSQAKPDGMMIYTNGMALCGNAAFGTGGMLKLGTAMAPSQYIEALDDDVVEKYPEWGTDGYRETYVGGRKSGIYDVLTMPGTTQSPYAGRTLVVDQTQELDGTLHIKLGGYAADTPLSVALAYSDATALPLVSDYDVATRITDGGVYYHKGTTSSYLGAPDRAGITARVLFDTASNVADQMVRMEAKANGVPFLTFREGSYIGDKSELGFEGGWLKLVSVPTENVDRSNITVGSHGVTKFAWCTEPLNWRPQVDG